MCLSMRAACRRGGGSACSKPIVWFLFHGNFPISFHASHESHSLSPSSASMQAEIILICVKVGYDYKPVADTQLTMLGCYSLLWDACPLNRSRIDVRA